MVQGRNGFVPDMQYFAIHVHSDYDAETVRYMLSLDKINLYGEGKTMEEAKADLVDSVTEWVDIYRDHIDEYEGLFNGEYKSCMKKLMLFTK